MPWFGGMSGGSQPIDLISTGIAGQFCWAIRHGNSYEEQGCGVLLVPSRLIEKHLKTTSRPGRAAWAGFFDGHWKDARCI
jgi:hypothetical protein